MLNKKEKETFKELNELALRISENLKTYEKERDNRAKLYKTIKFKVDDEINLLSAKVNAKYKGDEIFSNILAVIFGDGVIIPDELSVRRLEWYYYRHRYPLETETILSNIFKYADKIQDKAKIERANRVKEYFDRYNQLITLNISKHGDNNGKSQEVSWKFKKPFEIIDIDYRNEVSIQKVKGLLIQLTNISLIDEKDRRCSLGDYLNNLLIKKYKNRIRQMKEQVVERHKKFITECDSIIECLKKDFAKELVLVELYRQNKKE